MSDGNQGQNVFPDADNYPDSSFPQPVPAPDVDPDDAGTLITVRYSWHWQQVLLAAVDQLLNPATWDGDHDTIIDALNRAANLKDLLQINAPASDIAPYWQDETDIEGETPEGEIQQWWGVFDGLTFQESLENVFIAAYVGILGGVGAAVQFLVLARQFRLEFETDPYGGIVDILLNGDKYRSIDTYASTPSIISVDIIADGGVGLLDVDPKTLLIVLTDEPNDASTPKVMHVVRKRLITSEVSPPNFRYNPDTNQAQFSPDGGETWVDSPGTDPRHNTTYQFPPRGGSDPRCDAAANMVAALRFVIDVMIDAPTTLARINILLGYVKRFIPEIAFIIEIITYAVDFLSVIRDDLEDAFTEDAYDMIECSLFCRTEDDGSITADGIGAVLADVFAYDPDVLFTAVQFIFQTWWGEVSLSNAGAIGDAVGDCDDCECEWCWQVNFADSNGGFTSDSRGSGANYTSGTGWTNHDNGTVNGTYIHRVFSSSAIFTSAVFTYTGTDPLTTATTAGRLAGDGGFTQNVGAVSGTHVVTWTGSSTIDEIILQVGNYAMGEGGGTSAIISAEFRGRNENPFGDDNC